MDGRIHRRFLAAACGVVAALAMGGCPQNQILGGLFALDLDPIPFAPAESPEPTENTPPTVDAGGDLTAASGEVVILNGAGTVDPDADRMLFWWVQNGGTPTVELDNRFSSVARFVAPELDASATLTFRLTVIDGFEAVSEDVSVTISPQ